MIASALSPGQATRRPQAGHVILLMGEPEDLEARVIGRHKQSRADTIRDMQAKLKDIFDESSATYIDTFGLSIAAVLKRVARVLLLAPYSPVDLGACLLDIKNNFQKLKK
ncbi:hypothetical protein [Paramagnetospirillum magneticum]|uniref:hypothetical protein n=1 Tax=Paramagnetospirillum magneticum TaxID=84159 RepID=UPI0011D16E74|nr:hypothetical protein [Paramagnetospirillum magneticum]